MFYFFFNVCLCLWNGVWNPISNQEIASLINTYIPDFLNFVGHIFSDGGATLDPSLWSYGSNAMLIVVISTILSLITCISLYFLFCKALKKIFSVFLEWF